MRAFLAILLMLFNHGAFAEEKYVSLNVYTTATEFDRKYDRDAFDNESFAGDSALGVRLSGGTKIPLYFDFYRIEGDGVNFDQLSIYSLGFSVPVILQNSPENAFYIDQDLQLYFVINSGIGIASIDYSEDSYYYEDEYGEGHLMYELTAEVGFLIKDNFSISAGYKYQEFGLKAFDSKYENSLETPNWFISVGFWF